MLILYQTYGLLVFIFGLLHSTSLCLAFLWPNNLKSECITCKLSPLHSRPNIIARPDQLGPFQSAFYNENDLNKHTNITLNTIHRHLSKYEVTEVYNSFARLVGPFVNIKFNTTLDNDKKCLECLLDAIPPIHSVDGYTCPIFSVDLLEVIPKYLRKKVTGHIFKDTYKQELECLSWQDVCEIAFDDNLIKSESSLYLTPPIRLLIHLSETQDQLESLWQHSQEKFPYVCEVINKFNHNSIKKRLISTLNHLQLFSDLNITSKVDLKEVVDEMEIASSYIEELKLDQIDNSNYINPIIKSTQPRAIQTEEIEPSQALSSISSTFISNSNKDQNLDIDKKSEKIFNNKLDLSPNSVIPKDIETRNQAKNIPNINNKAYNSSSDPYKLVPSILNSSSPSQSPFQKININNSAILYTISKIFGRSCKPTDVQKLAIPNIMSGKNILFSSQTGTGKTLAFLLPILQKLKDQEMATRYIRQLRSPRCVILTPTRELTIQTLKVIKQFSHYLKISSTVFLGSKLGEQKLNSFLGQIYDIVVTSPQQLVENLKQKNLSLNHLKYLIIDEVNDIYLDGFEQDVNTILKHVYTNKPQIIMTTASPTEDLRRSLKSSSFFPNFEELLLENSFLAPQNIRYTFLSTQGQDKLRLLGDILQPLKDQKVIVFCNTIQSCRACEHYIKELGKASVGYHGKIPPKLRMNNFSSFMGNDSDILVTTDICSRGIDLEDVQLIILFDFPKNSIDFLHRIGRTGRMNNSGRVISLITKKDKSFALAIQKAIKQGRSLESIFIYKNVTRTGSEQFYPRSRFHSGYR